MNGYKAIKMTKENTRCRHKITFGSYILSDYYEYCVCKKCKKKFEVKKRKFDWLNLLIVPMSLGVVWLSNNPAIQFAVSFTPIIATLIIILLVEYRRYRLFCRSVYQEEQDDPNVEGNG